MAIIDHSDRPTVETSPAVEPGTIDLLDLMLVIARDRKRILTVTLVAAFVGAALALTTKNSFIATATILPPQQQQSSAASLMGQLGTLSALSGAGGASLGIKSPADTYVGILQSRTIADRLIAHFNLQLIYKQKKAGDTRAILKKNSKFEATKDGMIQISVEDLDPNRASDLTNGYVSALYDLNSTLAIGEASQRRLFFDKQLGEERNALNLAEDDLKTTQEKTGLIQFSGQAEAIIRGISETRAEIASRKVQLQALAISSTDQNPDVARMKQAIATLQLQLEALQNNQQRIQPGDIEMPAGRVPEAGLEYSRKMREVKYHETLFELLSKQYEAARIDEAKSAPIIQVIDPAIPPDRKSGPHRTLIILAFSFIGFCLSSLWSILSYAIKQMRKIPEQAAKLQELQHAVSLRSL